MILTPDQIHLLTNKRRSAAQVRELVHNAAALICVGKNDHLVELAKRYGLPVYEVDR